MKATNAARIFSGLVGIVAVLSVSVLTSGCSTINGPLHGAGTQQTKAPQGLAFYNPPSPLPPGKHGDVIWARPLHNDAALPHAAHNWLILYRSTNIHGQPIAVSGTLAVPAGKPPKGGWPVISWTHGTTGTADACAPSRDSANYPDKGYVNQVNHILDKWLQKGYAIAKTDYQGLGTPGQHPYLIGYSEARDATDMVLAARQVSPNLSRNWLVMGHSQGGQAAIFTSQVGPVYGQGLHMVGAVAISPASHLKEVMQYFLANGKKPASPFLPLLIQGAAAVSPAVKPKKLMTAQGLKQLKIADKHCLDAIAKEDKEDGLKTDQVLRMHANFKPLETVLGDLSDSGGVHPGVPLLVAQATNDHVVPKMLTDATVAELRELGANVTYKTYTVKNPKGTAGAHRGTIKASLSDAMQWVGARFRQ